MDVSLQIAENVFIAPDTDFTISISNTTILSRPGKFIAFMCMYNMVSQKLETDISLCSFFHQSMHAE